MRRCPHCYTENSDYAFFCHLCGRKIKNKVNGWLITFIIYFLITSVLGFLVVGLYQETASEITRLEKKMSRLELLKQEVENERQRLQSLVWGKDSEISDLKAQIPHIYTTKYANLYVYNRNCRDDMFEKTTYRYANAGSHVTVYLWMDGYGLTKWGWVPSEGLEKK